MKIAHFIIKRKIALLLVIAAFLTFAGCEIDTPYESTTSLSTTTLTTKATTTTPKNESTIPPVISGDIDPDALPTYSDSPFVVINNNQPKFSDSEKSTNAYEKYYDLDILGRCTLALASLGRETMPEKDEDRGEIGSVKPSGWVQASYDNVSGKYLYNRSHLIGWQLSAENANEKNLITGTRYMNTEGMLPFENMVADYIRETGNHVAYRITPIYAGANLLCSGVQMEAFSIEDNGEGICFNVYCFNVQPGIYINYATGESTLEENKPSDDNNNNGDSGEPKEENFILNTSSKKIHKPDCSSVKTISEKNKEEYTGIIEELEEQGYEKCKNCF